MPLTEKLDELSDILAPDYQNAKGFPHIAIKNFFSNDRLLNIVKELDDYDWENSRNVRRNEYCYVVENGQKIYMAGEEGSRKYGSNEMGKFGPNTIQMVDFLTSSEFTKFLEKLTGIPNLISDPKLVGGGIHRIPAGGFLKLHTDFNTQFLNKKKIYRRINLLLYLNEDWKDEWGGHLELWNQNLDQCLEKISPELNNMAIFTITDLSYHGHPDPLACPKDKFRKSIALYYYTEDPPNDYQKDHKTLWQKRKFPGQPPRY